MKLTLNEAGRFAILALFYSFNILISILNLDTVRNR